LAHDALQLPDNEWKVIFFSHAPIDGSITEIVNYNHNILNGILKAFRKGESYEGSNSTKDFECNVNVDFTDQGIGEIIAFVCGHLHGDINKTFNDYNCICTLDSSSATK